MLSPTIFVHLSLEFVVWMGGDLDGQAALFLDKAVGVTELEWWHHPCCPPEGPGQAGMGVGQEAVQFNTDSWAPAALQKSAGKHPLAPISESTH